VDYVVWLSDLKSGEINRSVRETAFAGGKGINVSTVLKNLGVETVATGFAAGFTGDAVLAELENLGIESDFVRLPSGLTRINVKLRHGGETDINCAGPDIGEDDINALLSKLERVREGDAVILSGSAPKKMAPAYYCKILEKLRERGAEITVDIAGQLLKDALAYRPFLIKPNREEIAELFGGSGEDVPALAARLQTMGARNVLVSMAEDGAFLLDENGNSHCVRAARGDLVNSVGAGDSMVAGFTAGYLETGDYDHALRLGAAAGSATAFSEGLAHREKIMEIYKLI
jgi:1-phosphofructokinase